MDSTRTDSTGLTASDMIRKLLKPSGHESRPITQGGHAVSEVADTPNMVADILKLFPGAEVVATERPLFCRDCDKALIADRERPYSAVSSVKDLVSLLDQRKSRIVQKTWPDGRGEWICSHCGRAGGGGRYQKHVAKGQADRKTRV